MLTKCATMGVGYAQVYVRFQFHILPDRGLAGGRDSKKGEGGAPIGKIP